MTSGRDHMCVLPMIRRVEGVDKHQTDRWFQVRFPFTIHPPKMRLIFTDRFFKKLEPPGTVEL